tara:strand:+ start:1478 stop:1645 length:168 start_codon:yes stop_codon:yes gene_type:complete
MKTVRIPMQEFQKLLNLRYKMESYFKYENDKDFDIISAERLEETKELLTELKKFD